MNKVWVVTYLMPATFGIVIDSQGSHDASMPALARPMGVFTDKEKALSFAKESSEGDKFKTWSITETDFCE